MKLAPAFRPACIIWSFLALALPLHAAVRVEKVAYGRWKNCWRVSNGDVEVIVTGDVGPRVIRYGFIGGQNLFKEFPDQLGKSGESDFQMRGGDRVWKAPEDPAASWAPDNVPVEITPTPSGLIARAPIEPTTRLQKEIEITMAPSGAEVQVAHRIWNRSLFTLEFSPWVLTMMAQGGVSITGFPPRGTHPANLEVTNPLSMWAYTDLSDPRLSFTKKYVILRQDPRNPAAEKIGLFNRNTWAAYILNGQMFLKRSTAEKGVPYPDFGCSFEEFANDQWLEVETLGPLTHVPPGGKAEQVEHWTLYRSVTPPKITDSALDQLILPLLQRSVAH